MNVSHQLTTQVKLLLKAVLISDDQFLIIKRSELSQSRPGKWDLPGGNAEWVHAAVDVTNPHRQDLIREIKEETGVVVDDKQLDDHSICFAGTYFMVSSHPARAEAIPQPREQARRIGKLGNGGEVLVDANMNGSETYTVILGWKIFLASNFDRNSIQLSDEHTEYEWISWAEFDDYDFGFAGEKDGFIRQMVANALHSSDK